MTVVSCGAYDGHIYEALADGTVRGDFAEFRDGCVVPLPGEVYQFDNADDAAIAVGLLLLLWHSRDDRERVARRLAAQDPDLAEALVDEGLLPPCAPLDLTKYLPPAA
jgi:hypothetical protein